jgi:hypothetical protein
MEVRQFENEIKFCKYCGCLEFVEIIVDSIDYIITEKEIRCKNCDSIVNYWSFGNYENDIDEKYIQMGRQKKLERIINE